MKNVLLITRGFPVGNHEKGFLQTEYRYLKQNFNVRILSILSKEEEISDCDDADIIVENNHISLRCILRQLISTRVIQEIIKAKRNCKFLKWFRRCKAILSYSVRSEGVEGVIERIVDTYGIDLIYTYWCTPATVAALRVKERRNHLKVITRFHGFDLYADRNKAEWQSFREYIVENSDGLFFACNEAKRYFTSLYFCGNKANVAYLGTEERRKLCPQNRKHLKIISCSTTKPEKRVELIADVVYRLSEKISVEWIHIGGDMLQFEKLDEAKIIYSFCGQLNHQNVINKFIEYRPDLFITLSLTEGGVPVSIQEAFSMGIPAVGTCVGGIPEIITNDNGILVDVNDSADIIANKIIRYANLSNQKKQMYSEKAYLTWERKFNASTNAERFINQLNMIMERG